MSEITTLETKLRRALIRDTDSAKLGSDLGPQTENAATNTPRYLGQGGPANLGVKEMAAVLTAQNKNMEQQIDEKKTSMSELLSELEGRNNKRSIFPDLWPTKGGTISSPYGGRSGLSVVVTTGIRALISLLTLANLFMPVLWAR